MILPLFSAAIIYTVFSIVMSLHAGIQPRDYETQIIVIAQIAWVGMSITAVVHDYLDYLDYKRNGD